MSSNKFFLWIAAVLLSGAFCAFSAVAEISPPAGYANLTAVDLAPGQTPVTNSGLSYLSGGEDRYRERLPMQLTGAMKKVKNAKYRPGKSSKHSLKKASFKQGKKAKARSFKSAKQKKPFRGRI